MRVSEYYCRAKKKEQKKNINWNSLLCARLIISILILHVFRMGVVALAVSAVPVEMIWMRIFYKISRGEGKKSIASQSQGSFICIFIRLFCLFARERPMWLKDKRANVGRYRVCMYVCE